ncbi:MAG: 50S ribosomal protein L9 [Candidatus Omnitrophota bacterium]|nr:50S ribosomal protein L9 [Candidatus Omnitrophota bacterium]MBU1929782.1 50S ribosomal protein L9 [Candidatus Omnitrophota bacterium]MBU2035216.1 50S ribosomal protein L9 [Candidatus Omnitrophota bacterium]MBU2257810.1 50S ribosomal protein L9 [Candidatus Omnitrophota bacterium]
MEVILIQDVLGIGKAGTRVKVKDGFARNYLLLKGLAAQATAANLKDLEQKRKIQSLRDEKLKEQAEGLKAELEKLSLTLPSLAQNETELYGSITNLDIERALNEEGFNIDKNSIVLDEPIKSLGVFEVPVKLHSEISAKIKVWIVKK